MERNTVEKAIKTETDTKTEYKKKKKVGKLGWFISKTQTSRACPLLSVLVSVSVFMALSTVFHSINSPDNPPLSHSVLLVSFLP